ncbi:MAG: hypothetical protein ABIP54_02810 [Candidatus Andersenbacteria bacterium]
MAKKSKKKSVIKKKLENMKFEHKHVALSLFLLIIVILALGAAAKHRAKNTGSMNTLSQTVSQVSDDGVTWLPEKQQIQIKEKLFTPDWTDADLTYYKVGSDNGKDIIVAILPSIDPSGDRKITMVHDGSNYKIIQAYSNVFSNGVYFGPPHADAVDESGVTTYHSLATPETLQVSQGNLAHIQEGFSKFFFSDYAKNDETRQTTLTPFIQTPWGQLYTYTVVLQGGNIPERSATFSPVLQQFVLKLADGEARTYQMHPQFVGDDNVLLASWNDGSQNKDAFSWNMTNGGCGASGFVEVLPDNEISNLIKIGTTVNGEMLYGFKTTSSQTLKGHYEQLQDGTYYFYDSASGESKQIPISLDEYNAKHGVVVYKDSFGRYDVFVNQKYGIGAECGKPVIYLYPTKATQISVQVGANITKSEPIYNSGWNVTAKPNGELTTQDGKQYTSLFWEGLGHGQYPSVNAGFVVPQKDIKATLWNQTHQLGLNDREAQDFMDFWLPKMPSTPYVRLTWFGTRQMDELAPLTVSPKPDTSIRIFLDFVGLQTQEKIAPQILSAPARKGFTLVEWGGLLRSGK